MPNLRVAALVSFTLLAGPAASDTVAKPLPAVSAQPPWDIHQRYDDPEEAYTVYKRKPAGSDYDAYRLEAVIDAPPAVVARAARRQLVDPEDHQRSMEKTILRDDDEAILVYAYISLPLVSDRDVTTEAEQFHDAETGAYRLAWRASEQGPPPKKGVVRLQKSDGSWTFTPLEGNRTFAVYESHAETGGAMPAWLVNSMMTDTVVEGIVGLRRSTLR